MEQNAAKEFDLVKIASVILHKLWIVILAGVLTASVAFAYSKLAVTPVYQASAKVYIVNGRRDTGASQDLTPSDLQIASTIAKDCAVLMKTRTVATEVAERLNLGASYSEIEGKYTVTAGTDSRILTITVRDTDPRMAAEIANTVSAVSQEWVKEVTDVDAVNPCEAAIVPGAPVTPNVMRNTLIGGLIGVVISIALIVLIYSLDDRIWTPEDIEKNLGLTTLASIPLNEDRVAEKKRNKQKSARNA